MKPSSDYVNPATKMLEEEEQKSNINIVEDVAGGSETAAGIRRKIESILQLFRKNIITLNPSKFNISRSIKVGGFKLCSNVAYPNSQMRPTRMAVNKVLGLPTPR